MKLRYRCDVLCLVRCQPVPAQKEEYGFPVCRTDAGSKGIAVNIPQLSPKTNDIIVFPAQNLFRQWIAVFHYFHFYLNISSYLKTCRIFPDLIPDMRILRADCYFYVWHISFHPLFASVARACLKNHFRKLGLAAHEKRFSDTLWSISLIISDFVDQL